MKTGRQCQDCLVPVHKKCEVKFNQANTCSREPFVYLRSMIADDEKSLISIDDIPPDNVKRRSFRRLRKKNVDQKPDPSTVETPKNDELDHSVEKRATISHRSSKIVSVASSAYSKIRDFKTKRSSASGSKRSRLSQDMSKNFQVQNIKLIFLN
jgi:hypothetical protein